jgi:hypothetical protein
MDVLGDAKEILDELGVHFENSASEATAAASLAASVYYPLRGAITFKSTVGTNVASDALANLASGGVTGGALIIVGEDYGEGSSIMQERSHAFAMKSQIWLLDPRPNLTAIVDSVDAASAHIARYGTQHTEAIISENKENVKRFIALADCAAVMVNTSTRFTDGEQMGFGAEIGISNQKLHARGPMGLEAMTTTTWIVTGNGQIRS